HPSSTPRSLPPFPTRRSSDLDRLAGQALERPILLFFHEPVVDVHAQKVETADDQPRELFREKRIDVVVFLLERVILRDFAVDHRSEEHTSELQSRVDLVCRLL